MQFLQKCLPIQLITVLDFEACPKETQVAPRSFHCLSFRLSGNAAFEDMGHSVTAKVGDILYMPAGAPYYLCRHENERVIAVHFEMKSEQVLPFDVFSPAATDSFKELFLSLAEIWSAKRTGYYCRAMSVFYKLLYQIQLHFSAETNDSGYDKIRPSVHYIHAHFCDSELSVAKLARMSAMSETYFRKLFSQALNMTPLQYINALRIDYATDLLAANEMSVEEIAHRCGFNDAKYFSTVFRKYKGTSPRRFATNQKE